MTKYLLSQEDTAMKLYFQQPQALGKEWADPTK